MNATTRRRRSAAAGGARHASAVLGLQGIDILKGLDARALREIADQCAWRRYKRGQYVIRRAGTDRDVYFVIAGQVRVLAQGARGRQIILRDAGAGEVLGEHSAIDGRPRFADVRTVRESLLAAMPPEAFRAMLANFPTVRERVLRRLSGSVRELADRVLDLGAQRVRPRVWAELLRLARRAGVQANAARVEPAPARKDIASQIGTSREEVSRELSRLAREGLIGREGRALVLRDVAALAELLAASRPDELPEDAAEGGEPPLAAGPRPQRERRSILVADAFDAVAMMERDEGRTVQRWRDFFAHAVSEAIPAHAGRGWSKVPGRQLLADFAEAAQALECAFELHRSLARFNAQEGGPPLALRIGGHAAEVVLEPFNLIGDGVNVAAGLLELANPGETLVSAQLRDQLTSGVDASIEDLGEQRLRNRERAVRAFRVWPAAQARRAHAPNAAVLAHGRPSVAVIPFQVRADDPRLEFLGDGLAEETIGALSRVADLFVVSRLSSMAFRRAPLGLRAIGQMLGVRYVLSGSIQTAGARALLHAELADARDGRILWNERYACDLMDAFAVQAELARKVVESAAPFVRSLELRRARITSFAQLDAYEITLRGITLMHRLAREDFLRARRAFETAAERDPVSPAPHAWLAKWHVIRVAVGASEDPGRDGAAATASAARALECDPDDALALSVSGHVAAWARHDLEEAETHLARALASNPNEPLAWLWTGMNHAWRGRGAEAVAAADRALSLSPLDPMLYYFHSLASTANLVDGRYRCAIELATRSLRANRLHTPTLRTLAAALVLDGQMDMARDAVRSLRALEPALTVGAFRARYPGRDSPQAARFADALLAAGLPA